MIEFISNNLTFLLFIVFLTFFLILKRKNLQLSGAFPFLYLLMYKTRWGLDKMNHWAKKHPKLFLRLSYLSIFIGIIGIFASFIFMVWQLTFIFDLGLTQGGGLVLPLKTESGLDSAVPVFYVPFIYWIIALFIMAVVHEFAHGVIAERFKVKIKSSGFAFMGILAPIFPAAFVEPDEKMIAKKPWWQQIAIMGAGSTSNFIFGFLFLLVWLFLAGPFIDKTMEIESIEFSGIMNESSLLEYNISSGKIIALNGEYDKQEIMADLRNLTPNTTQILNIESGGITNEYEIKTFPNPSDETRGMIGVSGINFNLENKEGFSLLGNFPLYFEKSIFWIWFLNLAIGIMNLLPIWITDGGQIARILFKKFIKGKHSVTLYNLVSWSSLILIIFTMWPKLMYFFFGLF